MSKFSFGFVTLSGDMEKTLKNAVLPMRRAIGRSITEAMEAPINNVQAKRLGISSHLAKVHAGAALTDDQKSCSDELTERWVTDVIEIGRRHGSMPERDSV